jgi:hypothetical protein
MNNKLGHFMKNNYRFLIYGIIIMISVIAVALVLNYRDRLNKESIYLESLKISSEQSQLAEISLEQEKFETKSVEVKKFTSEKLGVSFNYFSVVAPFPFYPDRLAESPKEVDWPGVFVEEIGSSVYITNESQPESDFRPDLVVFSKDQNDTLFEAVRKNDNHEGQECYVPVDGYYQPFSEDEYEKNLKNDEDSVGIRCSFYGGGDGPMIGATYIMKKDIPNKFIKIGDYQDYTTPADYSGNPWYTTLEIF